LRLDTARSAARLRQKLHLWGEASLPNFLLQQTVRLRACCLRRSPNVMHIDAAHCGSTGAEASACHITQLRKQLWGMGLPRLKSVATRTKRGFGHSTPEAPGPSLRCVL
jgi:hypothetical protein